MRATGALLGDVEVLVEVDDALVGAGIDAEAATGALERVDDDEAVVPGVEGAFDGAGLDARGVSAVHAKMRAIGHLHLGHGAAHLLGALDPELADLGLGFGIRGPVVGHVLVFADDLAVVAAVATGHVDDEDFLCHDYLPSTTQALNLRPEAAS